MDDQRILQIINSSGLGGAETIVEGIIKKTKHPVFCLHKDKVDKFKGLLSKIYFGTKTGYYKFNPLILNKLNQVIKEKNVRILHVHLATSLFYALLIKKFNPSIKIIYHEHGEIFTEKKLQFFLKMFKSKINLFIAVSKATKQQLIKKANIPQEKIIVLSNFVDLDKFNIEHITRDTQNERKKFGIKSNLFVIGFIGRLTEIKGCEYLIRSLPYLKFDYKVIIAGEGILKNKLKDLTKKLAIENNIIFLGYTPAPESVYPLLNVITIPSLNESFSLSAIEAMSMGIPVIASNVDGVNELVIDRKTGLLFKKTDYKNLAEKLNLLNNNKKLRDNIIKTSLRYSEKYSLKNYLKKLRTIYEHV